jgi:hypothetical protein
MSDKSMGLPALCLRVIRSSMVARTTGTPATSNLIARWHIAAGSMGGNNRISRLTPAGPPPCNENACRLRWACHSLSVSIWVYVSSGTGSMGLRSSSCVVNTSCCMFLGDTTTLMSMSIGVALDPVQCHGQSADQHIFDLVAVQCGEQVEVEHGVAEFLVEPTCPNCPSTQPPS